MGQGAKKAIPSLRERKSLGCASNGHLWIDLLAAWPAQKIAPMWYCGGINLSIIISRTQNFSTNMRYLGCCHGKCQIRPESINVE